MARPRAADDFSAIRARMEELRRERAQWARDPATDETDGNGRSISMRSMPLGKPDLRPFRDRGPSWSLGLRLRRRPAVVGCR